MYTIGHAGRRPGGSRSPSRSKNPSLVRQRERHDVDDIRRHDARRRLETFDQRPHERPPARLGVAARLEIERRRHDVAAVEPGVDRLRGAQARMKRPAATSSSTDIATCATRKAERSRPCRRPVPPIPFSDAHQVHARGRQCRRHAERERRDHRDDRREGRAPSSPATGRARPGRARAAASPSPAACTSTRGRGRAAPAPESIRFSVSSWRISRPRPAPSDCRTAISVRDPRRARAPGWRR